MGSGLACHGKMDVGKRGSTNNDTIDGGFAKLGIEPTASRLRVRLADSDLVAPSSNGG